jgi:hypothetical protein
MPAVAAGLDLDERVVRRHVAKLEAAGWLGREPWMWGGGSVVWLTKAGIQGTRLAGVRAVKSPPPADAVIHGVLLGWSAARVEHRGRVWLSARELAVEPDRWAVPARCERGFTKLLPDLAVWLSRSEEPVAVIAERGGRREERQKMILEGWRDAVLTGRYSAVHYHCVSDGVEHWIRRLAGKVELGGHWFAASVQMTAEQIASIPRQDDAEDEPPASTPEPAAAGIRPEESAQISPVWAPQPPPPVQIQPPIAAPPDPKPETPEQSAEREALMREIFGDDEPEGRWRWRR